MHLFNTIIIVVALTMSASFAKEREASARARSAVIVFEGESHRGIAHNHAITITDGATLRALEAFSPEYEKRPSSRQSAGWKRGCRIYFNHAKGKTFAITVSKNGGGAIWSTGNGDLATNGKFSEFVDALREKNKR